MRLIDADTLKEHKFVSIDCYLKSNCDNGFPQYKQGWNDAIDTIIDNAPTVERSEGGWIPVSERLPIRNGVYNVTRKLKEGETIYFISGACYFDGQNTWHSDICINHGRPYLTDIIAWQPLPKPYKEGGAI